MKKPKLESVPNDAPRDVSRPAMQRPKEPAGVAPSPESDSRTHQRFSGEGESRVERDKRKR